MENIGIEIKNNLEKIDNKIIENQNEFLESYIGKAINSAIDIGLKAALPDLIENQIIDIKNTILEQGFSEGFKNVIDKSLEFGKSTLGIVTGEFENISQIQLAIKKGGILDNVSKLLDLSINFAKSKNLITSDIANLVKKGKNSIISSISDKIEESLTNQLKAVEKIEKYCENWNVSYGNQDFSEMEKAYKNIKINLEKIVPLENIINSARKIENIHNLIKNNGNNFNITEEEILLAQRLV